MNCEYSEPINLEPNPELPAQWSYQKAVCQTEEVVLVENLSTEAKFYLDKKISYGEVLIVIFLSIFAIFIISKATASFVFKQK